MIEFSETQSLIKILEEITLIKKEITIKPEEPYPVHENKTVQLIKILKSDWINQVAGYFLNHRPDSYYTNLDNEFKIQDLVYVLATSIIPDLHYENPQSKTVGALTYTRIDFSSKNESLFLEIKHATDSHVAKKIESEISEDVVKYGKQGRFENLLFFIYCYNYHFPNARDFEKSFTGIQHISGNKINTNCVIKP